MEKKREHQQDLEMVLGKVSILSRTLRSMGGDITYNKVFQRLSLNLNTLEDLASEENDDQLQDLEAVKEYLTVVYQESHVLYILLFGYVFGGQKSDFARAVELKMGEVVFAALKQNRPEIEEHVQGFIRQIKTTLLGLGMSEQAVRNLEPLTPSAVLSI
jgi:hypothetical protein